jgi:23S rRNA (uridine2552-2'-O)-methyltransferase
MSLKSNYRDGDSFTKKAKKEGYRSRASYKLKEILENDITIKKGHSVLDLGSSPGGWSQVVSEMIGTSGKIAAVDLQEMDYIENCFFYLNQSKNSSNLISMKLRNIYHLTLFYQIWPPI